jgi:TRAP-type C4-dicarboxylate transport system permease small subunit
MDAKRSRPSAGAVRPLADGMVEGGMVEGVPVGAAAPRRRARSLLPPGPPAPAPIRALGWAVDWAVVLIGGFMVSLVVSNVVLHAFHRDIAWTTELCELMMVWVTFLGAAAAARRGAHMAITEIVDLTRGRGRLALEAAIQSGVAIVLLMLTAYGWSLANSMWGTLLTVLDWPMAVQYLALPIGSAIALVFTVWDLSRILLGRSRAERFAAGVGTGS